MQLEERRWTRNLNGSGNRGQMRLDRSLVYAGILSHLSKEPRANQPWPTYENNERRVQSRMFQTIPLIELLLEDEHTY